MVSFWMMPCACCFASLPSFGFRSTRYGAKAPGPYHVEHRDVERRRLRREDAGELRVRCVGRRRVRNDLHLDPGVLRELLRERDVTVVAPADGVADERDRLAAVLLLDRRRVRHLRRRVGRGARSLVARCSPPSRRRATRRGPKRRRRRPRGAQIRASPLPRPFFEKGYLSFSHTDRRRIRASDSARRDGERAISRPRRMPRGRSRGNVPGRPSTLRLSQRRGSPKPVSRM